MNIKLSPNLTKSQIQAVKDLNESTVQGEVTSTSMEEGEDRARVGLKTKCGFTYSLYVGKRGKVYETEYSND